jgi:hypothetical protein
MFANHTFSPFFWAHKQISYFVQNYSIGSIENKSSEIEWKNIHFKIIHSTILKYLNDVFLTPKIPSIFSPFFAVSDLLGGICRI